ncbi:hypothetical protein DF024_23820 [Burkholderia cenocepacia]|nr:hypothetical protein AS149_23550 [Burkholderia cenocepacia]RQV59090.1 hypothetical protein DF024_23820 [Burkholderia cenocepacia]
MLLPVVPATDAPPRQSLQTCKSTFVEVLRRDAEFAYVLPQAAVAETMGRTVQQLQAAAPDGGLSRSLPRESVKRFDAFRKSIEAGADARVPAVIRGDPVYIAFRSAMIKSVATAQTSLGFAAGIPGADKQAAEVQAYSPNLTVTLREFKDFSAKISRAQLRPVLRAPVDSADAKHDNLFAAYFSAYYDGKFIDRFGQKISKPALKLPDLGSAKGIDLSITVSDADISGALTVLVEYLADLVDTTPVFGVTSTAKGANTVTYYPGGSDAEPTALTSKAASYKDISAGCGVTAKNAKVLGYVAKGAGDVAQLENGLIAQSAGGFGVSLGIFGKISVGDNQTLGTAIKVISSRAAMRIAFASAYLALEQYSASNPSIAATQNFVTGAPEALDPAGPNGYLDFLE